jgi:hypothetical protein
MDYHVSTTWLIVIALLVVWDMVWKALALWRAARNNDQVWFVAVVILNTAGILPIIYLLTHKSRNISIRDN